MPKRYGNLWNSICDLDNIKLAHAFARQDKSYYDAVIKTDNNLDERAKTIREMLLDHSYKVG